MRAEPATPARTSLDAAPIEVVVAEDEEDRPAQSAIEICRYGSTPGASAMSPEIRTASAPSS